MPAWDEWQTLGYFNRVQIYGHADSVWILGAAAGVRYPAFVFTKNGWITMERSSLRENSISPVITQVEGVVQVQIDDEVYYVNVENAAILVRKMIVEGGYRHNDVFSKSEPMSGGALSSTKL
jgi:hypothetical protein